MSEEMDFVKREQRDSIAKTFCVYMYGIKMHELQVHEFMLNCYKFADDILDNTPYLKDMGIAYSRSLAAKKAAHQQELNKMPYEPFAYTQMR